MFPYLSQPLRAKPSPLVRKNHYLLKQLTASLIYPEKDLGKDFWNEVYAKAARMYGTTQIPVNTFNKVWILPDTARVYAHGNTVVVVKSHLRVMLDEDYLALRNHAPVAHSDSVNNLGAQVVRQVVLPAIEREVNTGKNFVQMRQIYNSMILAFWFKQNLKQALLNQVYTDKSKVNGVRVNDPAIQEKIYNQYVQAYKKGVFNFIKEETDPVTQQTVPRKYFSGGLTPVRDLAMAPRGEAATALVSTPGEYYVVSGLTQNAATAQQQMWQRADQMGLKAVIMLEFEEEHPWGGGDINSFVHALVARFHHVTGSLMANFPYNPGKDVHVQGQPAFSCDKIIALRWKGRVYLAPHLRSEGMPAILDFFKRQGLGRPKVDDQMDVVWSDAAMTAQTVPLIPTDHIRPVKFGTSGDRWVEETWKENGIVSADHINRVGVGIAEYFNQATPGKVMLIGYDPRQHNLESARALASLYAGYGIKVRIIAAEPTPSPVLGLMTNRDENIGGVTILTASHSPWTDRGIKFSLYHGGTASSEATNQIQTLANEANTYKAMNYEQAKQQGLIEEVSPEEAQRIYVDDYVVPKLKELGAWNDIVTYIRSNPDFEMVLDPMQGTGVRYLKAIYDALSQAAGRRFYTMINTNNNDVRFSKVNGEPNPTLKKSRAAFEAAVQQEIADGKQVMGASVDADSDRFGTIDSNGKFVSSNGMIALIAYFLKKEIGLDGAIGKTVATSNFVNAVAKYLGLAIDEEPVGFKYFVDNVSRGRKYLIAGEESSHVAVGPFMSSWDDGFVVGLMGLWITARTGKSLSEYKDLVQKRLDQKFVIDTITIRGEDDSIKNGINAKINQTKEELAEGKLLNGLSIVKEVESLQGQKVTGIITKDGVKLVLGSGDWILMRPSGTEPAVKLCVEVAGKYSSSSAEMKQKFDQLVAVGKKIISSSPAMVGRPSQELENILSQKVGSVKESLQPLLDAYYAAKAKGDSDEVKRLDSEINKIVDRLNVYDQSKPEDLELSDDIQSLAKFLSGPRAGAYRNLAEHDLLMGNYVPQFIFAGAATRLGRGPMYNLDIWDVAEELGKAVPSEAKFHLGMGPRQIIAYRLALEGLAQQAGISTQRVLARQKMIVNVNGDIEQQVFEDFIKNN